MRIIPTLVLALALHGGPATAQLGLPDVRLPPIGLPGEPLGRVLDDVTRTAGNTAERLLRGRTDRIDRLLRRNRNAIEADAQGDPARRGELLLVDPSPVILAAAGQAGFVAFPAEELGSLDLRLVRLAVPQGMSLAEAQAALVRVAPEADIAADNLYFQAGSSALLGAQATSSVVAAPIGTPVGVIDGAPGTGQTVAAVRGFARGAPMASHHGSAIISLLSGAGAREIRVADVYGSDPAGGSAMALIRALDWLTGGGARVISISLGGPNNSAVGTAIAAVQRQGVVVIAAVGNDGPAAPPAYPASYPGVIAVTAVDARNRLLIEAGQALHLDYAAPGANILASNRSGRWVEVRGTSYAVPLVAARAAAAVEAGGNWRARLDREAENPGSGAMDRRYGRGLLCRSCARSR